MPAGARLTAQEDDRIEDSLRELHDGDLRVADGGGKQAEGLAAEPLQDAEQDDEGQASLVGNLAQGRGGGQTGEKHSPRQGTTLQMQPPRPVVSLNT